MPERRTARITAAGGAVFLWLERLCDLGIIITACAVYQSRVYLLAPSFILYKLIYETACEGILFAVSSVTSYYRRRKDTRGIMMVHYIGSVFAIAAGIIAGVLAAVLAGPFARLMLGSAADAADIALTRNLLWCMAPFAILEWLCAVYRGSERGMKRNGDVLHSISYEQMMRLLAVIVISLLAFYMLKTERRVIFYLIVLLSSLCAGWILKNYLKESQGIHAVKGKEAGRIIARLNRTFGTYCGSVIAENLWLLIDFGAVILVGRVQGLDYAKTLCYGAVIVMEGANVLQIPLLVSFNVTAGMLSEVETAYHARRKDLLEKHVAVQFSRVLTMTLPIAFFIIFHGTAVWRVLFHFTADGYTSVFTALGAESALYCLSFETSYLLVSMDAGRSARYYQIFAACLRVAVLYPMVQKWGMLGIVLSGILAFAVILFMDLSKVNNKTDISYRRLGITAVKTLAACMAMQGGAAAVEYFLGMSGTDASYIKALGEFALMLGAAIACYLMAGSILRLFPKRRKKNVRTAG